MPHSNDRTIVTAAGDAEVRVFDIEKSGRSTIPSGAPGTYKGVQYLSYGDTNTRIYRSHADRVKRIVTESSPFLFLYVSPDRPVKNHLAKDAAPTSCKSFYGAPEQRYTTVFGG